MDLDMATLLAEEWVKNADKISQSDNFISISFKKKIYRKVRTSIYLGWKTDDLPSKKLVLSIGKLANGGTTPVELYNVVPKEKKFIYKVI